MELERPPPSHEKGQIVLTPYIILEGLMISQMETYQVAPDKPTHGYEGPIKVSHGGAFTNIGKQ